MSSKVTCSSCGWSWSKSDSSKKDMYVCHQCGKDNTMKDGGWLNKYDDGGVQANYNDASTTEGPDYVGLGYDITGRDYSPAWGGQFEHGGTVPGSVGFSYARTKGIPSNGPYAKKTKASAQNGKEISYDQWKKKYKLNETPDYNLKRAWELGYSPDETGHLPTVDNQTGQFLKAKGHPTIKLELDWYNSPEGAEFKSKNTLDSTGKFFKYIPKLQNGKEMQFYQNGLDWKPKSISRDGSVIEDDRGQWDHPGEVTKINSNEITMQGVDYPVLGVSDTGDTQMMQPGEDYTYDGKSVTEYPMMEDGGWLSKYDIPKAQTGLDFKSLMNPGIKQDATKVGISEDGSWGKQTQTAYEQYVNDENKRVTPVSTAQPIVEEVIQDPRVSSNLQQAILSQGNTNLFPQPKDAPVNANKPIALDEVVVTPVSKRVEAQRDIIQKTKPKNNYSIVDKKNNIIHYYNPSGELINKENIITGASNKDTENAFSMREYFDKNDTTSHEDYFNYLKDTQNQSTPSGIFNITSLRENTAQNPDKLGSLFNKVFRPQREKDIENIRLQDYGEQQKLFTLASEYGVPSSKAIHGTGRDVRVKALADNNADRNLSNGCVNVNGETVCFDTLGKGSSVYVLPEENDELLHPDQKRKSGRGTNKVYTNTKSTIADALYSRGIKASKDAINFISSVAEKESKGGRSKSSQIQSLTPYAVSHSQGMFEINPDPKAFGQYLPKDFDNSIGAGAEAVYNFYNSFNNLNPVEKYREYTGAKDGLYDKAFKKVYDRMSSVYEDGGDIPQAQAGLNFKDLMNPGIKQDATKVVRQEMMSEAEAKKLKARKDAEELARRKQAIATSAAAKNRKSNMFYEPLSKSNVKHITQNYADETGAIADKFRMYPNDPNSFIDDYINPGVAIGHMASALGRVPLNIQEGNYGEAAMAMGTPLAFGALEQLASPYTSKLLKPVTQPIAQYLPAKGELYNELNGLKRAVFPSKPTFINPTEQELLSTVRNVGIMSKTGADDALVLEKILNKSSGLNDSQFESLVGSTRSQLEGKIKTLKEAAAVKKPDVNQAMVGDANIDDGWARMQERLRARGHDFPSTSSPRQTINLTRPTNRIQQEEIAREARAIHSGMRNEALGNQLPPLPEDFIMDIGSNFNWRPSLENKSLIKGLTDKINSNKYLPISNEKAQALLPSLYRNEGNNPAAEIIKAYRTLEGSPKGSTFKSASSLSTDSYPATMKMTQRALDNNLADVNYTGMGGLNYSGFSQEASIPIDVNLKEINTMIDMLNKKLPKPLPYAYQEGNSIIAPQTSLTKKKNGGWLNKYN